MPGEDQTTVHETPSFAMLPAPVGREPEFAQCLRDLIVLTGVQPPDEPSWCRPETLAREALRQVFNTRPAEPEWFEALLRAAIHDPNPSSNRTFVKPMLAGYGLRRVQHALIERLAHGSSSERAGAASAWYWARGLGFGDDDYTVMPQRPDDDRCADLAVVWRHTALRVFVTDPDLDARRSILPMLPLAADAYPPELHPLVDEAIRIARTSSDEYLRHRVEHQVGGCGSHG
ncbi:hypothetical protein ACFQZ4_09565 [Catellatospora coxensis]|uniref:Uncharacterized protein n=1 Tax=Catellatospora coxensis TaxID=310354 RepID=A0A8J3KL35_9ACTN|nr:hypothetical protein [Catellatospora coxensis]GIG04977.1 hypothetical protein Cco03nite_16770 [Catellatospora coxensis]